MAGKTLQQFTLGDVDETEVPRGPTKVVPCVAAIVRKLTQRAAWEHDRPFKIPDLVYTGAFEEMRKEFVIQRGFSAVPADEGLLADGVEHFIVYGATVVPEGDTGMSVTPSLDAARDRQRKGSLNLWEDVERRRRMRGTERI